jgi:hypothetical protein
VSVVWKRKIVPSCENCGNEVAPSVKFCSFCGSDAHSRKNPEDVKEMTELCWSNKMPVFTSVIVIKQLVMVFGLGCLLLAIILTIVSPGGMIAFLKIASLFFVFFVMLSLAITAFIQVRTKGGPLGEFAVTAKGIGYRAGKNLQNIDKATLIGSIAAGSLYGTGGSLINIAREMDFIAWDEMRSITAYTRDNSILFYRKVLIGPIALYCTSENFDAVLNLIRKYAPHLQIKMKEW